MRHPLRRKAVRTIGSAGILAVIATQQPVLAVSGEAEAPACNGVSATIIGTAASEVIHGTDGSDVIVAGAGDDSIVPGGGNDIVCAEEGNDVIRGIEPEGIRRYDSFSGGLGDDLIRIGPGGGRVAGDDFPVYSSGEVLPYPGGGNDLLIGSGRSDRFHPGPGDDIIRGGRQRAGVGRDIVEYRGVEQGIVVDLRRRSAIGDGRDTLRNIEQVIGSDFADQLTGSNRSDHLIGWGDDDRIVGAGAMTTSSETMATTRSTGGAATTSSGGTMTTTTSMQGLGPSSSWVAMAVTTRASAAIRTSDARFGCNRSNHPTVMRPRGGSDPSGLSDQLSLG